MCIRDRVICSRNEWFIRLGEYFLNHFTGREPDVGALPIRRGNRWQRRQPVQYLLRLNFYFFWIRPETADNT